MIERAGRAARPHFLVPVSPVQVFARPVPAGRAQAGRSFRPEIGPAAYGCRADCARRIAREPLRALPQSGFGISGIDHFSPFQNQGLNDR